MSVPTRTQARITANRERLVAAAWSLAMERPWADVTVADVCERADVAPRTFYRYFTDKSDLFFSDADRHEQVVTTAVARHAFDPDDPWTFAEAVFAEVAPEIEANGREAFARRMEIVASDPDLVARDLLKRHSLEAIVVTQLATVLPPTIAPVWAGVFVAVLFAAVADGANGDEPMARHLHRAIAAIRG